MKGRKSTPTEIHLTQGTYRPGRHAPSDGAGVLPGVPDVPSAASESVKAAWTLFTGILDQRRTVTLGDAPALEILARAWVEYHELMDMIEKDGRTYKVATKAGGVMVRANPAVSMMADCARRLNAALASFGLDPASRSKIPGLGESLKVNKFAVLGGSK